MIAEKEIKELVKAATKTRKNAYAPYSEFKVGAAVLSIDGRVFSGCNVENAAYSPSVCAERIAIGNAVSQGVKKFKALAVVSENQSTPCGVCRQVIFEFVKDRGFPVLLADVKGDYKVVMLGELFPSPFELK